VGERLGHGGSGDTFAATDLETGTARVLKLFRRVAAADALAEFRGLETFAHPSIVRVHDIGRLEDGRIYIATERVGGPTVDRIAAIVDEDARRSAFERAAVDLASALAHLHARGVVHGDVTPANVRLQAGGEGLGRSVLIDFGLAGGPLPAGTGGARGTLGYAPPEALVGARTPSTDLFALGATLFEAWAGTPPFGRGLAAVERMLAGRAPSLSAVRAGLGEGWDQVIARLLEADPVDRPGTAREVLREALRLTARSSTPSEIDLAVPYPEGDPVAGVVVGRASERAVLRAALDRLADGAADVSVLALVGPAGSGRRTLAGAVAREAAVAEAAGIAGAIDMVRGDVASIAHRLGVAWAAAIEPDPLRAAQARWARIAEALEQRARERPVCVWLSEGVLERSLAEFVAGAPPSGRALIVLPASSAITGPFARTVELGPFSAEEIRHLIRLGVDVEPFAGDAERIAVAAGVSGGMVSALARRAIARLRAGEHGPIPIDAGRDLDAILRPSFVALALDAQRLVLALSFDETGALLSRVAVGGDAPAALRAAREAGWIVSRGEGTPGLATAAHGAAALATATVEAIEPVAKLALSMFPADDSRTAAALVALGDVPAATAIFVRGARAALATGDRLAATLAFERAHRLAPDALGGRDRVELATGLGVLARYDEAASVLGTATETNLEPPDAAELAERRAWLASRRGDLSGARRIIEDALHAHDPDTSGALALRARLARLAVTLGDFRAARDAAAAVLGQPRASSPPVRALALEAALLAHAYLAEPAQARRRLAELRGSQEVREGRLAYLEALLAQIGGDETGAAAGYRGALAIAQRELDVHTVAAVALNLGGLSLEQGELGDALDANARAVRELGRVGAHAELGPALVNSANLFVELGDLAAARRALARVRALPAEGRARRTRATATFVEADIARRSGEAAVAAGIYERAALELDDAGFPADAASALAFASGSWLAAGRADAARNALAEAVRRAVGDADPDLLRAHALHALQAASPDVAQALDLARRIDAVARQLAARRRRPRAWRLAALSSQLFRAASRSNEADAALALARTIFEEIRMATPDHHRPALGRDSDAAWLADARAGGAETGALASRALAAESRLRRLLRINKRLNSELRLPRLLEMIVDTVIELTDAERGFILLEDDSGALTVKVARNIDQRTLDTAEFEVSRSIARKAAAGGEPVVTIDAAGDARFREAHSVSDLHLRSVLAVPLIVKGRAVGTIYVDHRLRQGAFDQEDVRLVLDFAEQAAIAIENARLLGELRRRERQVEALNRRLEADLAARREELSGMKLELGETREALAIRYDYGNILGRTPRMLELFRLLDRITDTSLPVVIQGESGTGKELVARALHTNGPRRGRPFVGENCAAIPETLLESTLFGYVRGAFTGAEHDTKGLFEIADTGTLFLDEVGEMSPAMQGKLLRVLQEGELRRVGSERTRKVDVRIVAATNRDLTAMVEENKFRRDLYFRLNVANIALPPLRDRRDDIPLLVAHFLARLSKTAGRSEPRAIDPAALGRLCAYRWPGNVRELENELSRVDALAAGRITVADLSPRVAAADDEARLSAEDPDKLTLKPRVERLERSLLREALGRCGNNQTKAAELLGLSRFGLQKKLKRYNFT
jgi:transcriptional regulator with GAF, ATPase, and Fis domain